MKISNSLLKGKKYKMKKMLTLLVFLFTFSINAQVGQTYYVNSLTLNLREQPSTSSEIIKKLKKYDNVTIINNSIQNDNWVKIKFENVEGFVSKKYLKKGKVIIDAYEVRTGAKCNDGTTSSATGRGACSHHRGVAYWITRTEKSTRIINN